MKELLVPAGDMECLYQAINNGCDAVYISGKDYGARKFASNFTNVELIDAIKLCHLYGVKVYVTMNTLVKNDEVEDFINQIRFLHKNGVDAVIMQDFGMICLVREKFPNLEIHASTQFNNSSKETCQLLYDLGVKRVVFSRELSIDEIDNIDIPIEKEAFIHGALCVSYSGCCLMSSMLGGRSGNRGECAGCCRMPYTLHHKNDVIEKKKYLISMKELNTSSHIQRLLDSSIYSFKIEGRMKSALYVGFITRFYRHLIDGRNINYQKELDKLKTIFNREFTGGHIFYDDKLINKLSPNHIGLNIGKASITDKKIKITLEKEKKLHQFDAIRFLNSNKGMIINYLYDKNGNYCSEATNICYVDNKIRLDKDDDVNKTQDYLLEKEFISFNKKINISYNVLAKVGEKIRIAISDGINEIIEEGSIVQKPINSPVETESIKKQLGKLGNTPFILKDIEFDVEKDIFIQIGEINKIRRILVEKLINKRESANNNFLEKELSFEKNNEKINSKIKMISCYVYNEEQLKACLELDVVRIYINDYDIYNKYKSNSCVYYAMNRCEYDISSKLKDRNLCSEIFDFKDNIIYGNYSMNILNIYTAYYLKRLGLKNIILSVELDKDQVCSFVDEYINKFGDEYFEVLSYGRVLNMIIKGNILNLKDFDYNYKLVDFKNREFPVYFDQVNTHILNYEKRNIYFDNNKIIERIDFYEEDSMMVKNICLQHINENF